MTLRRAAPVATTDVHSTWRSQKDLDSKLSGEVGADTVERGKHAPHYSPRGLSPALPQARRDFGKRSSKRRHAHVDSVGGSPSTRPALQSTRPRLPCAIACSEGTLTFHTK